jgi:hypothetical protein
MIVGGRPADIVNVSEEEGGILLYAGKTGEFV